MGSISTHDMKLKIASSSKAAEARSLGLPISENSCPKCGSPMFIKRAPCFLHKKGFSKAERCFSCGYQRGYQ